MASYSNSFNIYLVAYISSVAHTLYFVEFTFSVCKKVFFRVLYESKCNFVFFFIIKFSAFHPLRYTCYICHSFKKQILFVNLLVLVIKLFIVIIGNEFFFRISFNLVIFLSWKHGSLTVKNLLTKSVEFIIISLGWDE